MEDDRLAALEARLGHLEEKMDLIMEQVQLGRHLWMFAKALGWGISVAVGAYELFKGWKG